MDKLENEQLALKYGVGLRADSLDDHLSHIRHHKQILTDPNYKCNPQVVENIMSHIKQHQDLLIQSYNEYRTAQTDYSLLLPEGVKIYMGAFKDMDLEEREKEKRNRKRIERVVRNMDSYTIDWVNAGNYRNITFVDPNPSKIHHHNPDMYVSFFMNIYTNDIFNMLIRSEDGDCSCTFPFLDQDLAYGLDQEIIDFFGGIDPALPSGRGSWHGSSSWKDPNKHECKDNLEDYVGLFESFKHCKICGKKESEI